MSDLSIVLDAARKWAAHKEAGGYADEAETIIEATQNLERDTSIDVYLTGDEDGPDLFGVIYDEEDGALEAARENEVHAWRVPAQLYGDRAVRLESDSDE